MLGTGTCYWTKLTYLDWPFYSLSYLRCQHVRMNLSNCENVWDKKHPRNVTLLHRFPHGHTCFFERPKIVFATWTCCWGSWAEQKPWRPRLTRPVWSWRSKTRSNSKATFGDDPNSDVAIVVFETSNWREFDCLNALQKNITCKIHIICKLIIFELK